ncbi:MFS transporter [Paenisporosarcina quisquiliarum]|uniref:MFS transporter n=1 Tax=Paenisporosarcina quisquiliarum TaxID=365346 RepID=A0A9X3LI39_9BACL|nr:MFS transporter [Paenisporosarcina quisquiliarum]
MNNRRSFYFLWVSQMMANGGDVLYIVGLIQLVYVSSGSVLTLTLIPLTITFSRLVGSFLTPLLLHRFPLRQILLFSMVGKIIFLSAVFFSKEESILWILILVSVIAFLDGWATPIRQAMLPELVGKSDLPKVNSLVAISDNTINLVSWPIGAFFVALFSGGTLLLVTIGLYIFAWMLTYGIKAIPHAKTEVQSLFQQLSGGWKYSFSVKPIRNILLLDTLTAFAGAVWISAILYVYVDEVLEKSTAWWGYINAFYSGGFLIGGYLFAKLMRVPAHLIIGAGCFLTSLLTVWFLFPHYASIALVISLFLGVFGQLQLIAQLTVMQTQTDTDQLGHVFSVQSVLVTGAFGFATLMFGWIAESFGIENAFYFSALLSLGAGVFAFSKKNTLMYVINN